MVPGGRLAQLLDGRGQRAVFPALERGHPDAERARGLSRREAGEKPADSRAHLTTAG